MWSRPRNFLRNMAARAPDPILLAHSLQSLRRLMHRGAQSEQTWEWGNNLEMQALDLEHLEMDGAGLQILAVHCLGLDHPSLELLEMLGAARQITKGMALNLRVSEAIGDPHPQALNKGLT
mmetsp:Transcript_34397/g.60863  ORF Transcript_34397/g.60863 Transcript_34397/m.60863 type:complete len:121 (-) Transcript_34397:1031-1393(-)